MACSDGPRTGVGVWRLAGVTVEVLVTPQKAEETGYSAGRLPCAADSPLSHTPNGDVIGCEEKEFWSTERSGAMWNGGEPGNGKGKDLRLDATIDLGGISLGSLLRRKD